MNPVNRFSRTGLHADGRDESETTESGSEDEAPADARFENTASELARALMAWSHTLIGPDFPACASHPAADALARFLTTLEVETRPRLILRREVLAWLRGLDGNAQRQVLDEIGRSSEAVSAIELYRHLRAMT